MEVGKKCCQYKKYHCDLQTAVLTLSFHQRVVTVAVTAPSHSMITIAKRIIQEYYY